MIPRPILFAALVVVADAFVVLQPNQSSRMPLAAEYDKKGHHITLSAVESFKGGAVDMKRAHECAESFGKCSVEEMEQIKSSKSLD